MKQTAYLFRTLAAGALIVTSVRANPNGGDVASGAATITGQGTSAVTINQGSATAIINWNSFSIGNGESTKFVQPGSSSATLNRVLGGGVSLINGSLSANGQIYLINQNGILVGSTGVINTAGFTASTRDIADGDFLSGKLHFVGENDAGVQNLGTINAIGGNVVLIGKTVDNEGTLRARAGTVALAAADDVLVAQKGAPGSTILVRASSSSTSAAGQTGVNNGGRILAARAQLVAANGNIYALAINNSGAIRATTLKHQGGHIFLTADGGTMVNSGTLNASATASGGTGGTVKLKNTGGVIVDSGTIVANGGHDGAGGNAEVSGAVVQFTGKVSLTAPGGSTGTLLFDPENVIIESTGAPAGSAQSTYTGNTDDSIVNVADLENSLASANVTVVTGTGGSQAGDITVTDAVTWSSANSLTLSAYHDVDVNADLTNSGGANVILHADNTGTGAGTVNFANGATVSTSGITSIYYNPLDNPSGSAVNPTSYVTPTSYTSDVSGPVTAYMLVNTVNDLQNMENNLTGDYALGRNIDASATANWNSGAGFIPIGSYDGYNSSDANTFSGTLDGQGYMVSGIYINRPGAGYAGFFGDTANNAVITNLNLTNLTVTGGYYAGGLVGVGDGTFTQDSVSGTVTGSVYVGGFAGITYASLDQVQSSGLVVGNGGSTDVGGLVGFEQGGSITNSFSTANVTTGAGSYSTGGLVGENGGSIMNTYAVGTLSTGAQSSNVGGLVGNNGGTISNSFWDTTTAGSAVTTGVGNEGNNTPGVTAATSTQLMSESYILANAPAQPTFNFSTIFAIDPSVNGGLPYLIDSPAVAGGGSSSGGTGSGGSGSGASMPGTPGLGDGGLVLPGLTAFASEQVAAQTNALASDYAHQFSAPPLKLVFFKSAPLSFTGGNLNNGEGLAFGLDDLGHGSSGGQMVTPSNGYFSIVPGAVTETPVAAEIFHQFENVLDDSSLDVLHRAAASGR